MDDALPEWMDDDAESVRAEAASYREMSPEQRLVLLAAACRAAARMLRSRPDAEDMLSHRDPLPRSSQKALERLRREARRRRRPGGVDDG
ncbi:MAG: hypothetical protein R6V85_11115 [Polyangia bacterium]